MKTALVIGPRKAGIGSAVAARLISDGFEVHGLSDTRDPGDETVPQLKSNVEVDLANSTALLEAVRGLPLTQVDAVAFADFFFEMEHQTAFDWNLWQRSLAINLTAPHIVFRELRDKMSPNSSFAVVTSTEAFKGSFGASAYAACKAAVHNLVMTLANVSGERGIRVNAVAAGWIGGVMDTDEVFNMSRKITPLGRLGTPSEVASVVSFLLGPDASFVNSATIVVDGGYSGVDSISKFEFEAQSGNS